MEGRGKESEMEVREIEKRKTRQLLMVRVDVNVDWQKDNSVKIILLCFSKF